MSARRAKQIGAELVAFLDGELADDERRPVAAHVSTCLTCRREIERLDDGPALGRGRCRRIEPSPELRGAISGGASNAESAPAGAATSAGCDRCGGPFRRSRPPPCSRSRSGHCELDAGASVTVARDARGAAAPVAAAAPQRRRSQQVAAQPKATRAGARAGRRRRRRCPRTCRPSSSSIPSSSCGSRSCAGSRSSSIFEECGSTRATGHATDGAG